MRLLGIDYGLRNVGLALGVSRGSTLPLDTITSSDVDYVINRIKKICEEEHIDKIVIGIPEFSDSTQKELTLSFAHKLEDLLEIPVVYVDEFGTTKEVMDTEFTKFSNLKKLKKRIHSLSAEKILESYWDTFGEDTFSK